MRFFMIGLITVVLCVLGYLYLGGDGQDGPANSSSAETPDR
jgi:hypothetical protein